VVLKNENETLKNKIASLEKMLANKENVVKRESEGRCCPVCGKKRTNLSRHLRNVHNELPEVAKHAVDILGQRKKPKIVCRKPKVVEEKSDLLCNKKIKIKKPSKNYHKRRLCAYPGCYSPNLRMSLHIQECHKSIQKGSLEYYRLLSDSKRYDIETDVVWKERTIFKIKKDNSKLCDPSKLNNTGDPCDSDLPSDEVLSEQAEVVNTDRTDNITEMLDNFVKFKVSVDGGRGDLASAMQSKQQIKTVMSTLNSDNFNDLFNRKKIRDTFLHDYADNNYKPATIMRYLLSMQHFYDFLLTEELKIEGVAPEDFLRMKVLVNRWRTAYKDAAEESDLLREMDEEEILITPEQIQKYHESASVSEALTILDRLSSRNQTEVSRQEFCCVRDYLITEIEILSCHRSGVSSNMTLPELNIAKKKDLHFVIKVKKHKTFRKHGPAHVCVSEQLYSHIMIYVYSLRSLIQNDLENVFISFFGKKLKSGAISKQINSVWQRAGVYGENGPPIKKNISANIFRKSGSTLIAEKNPEKSLSVASLLTHSETMSKKKYRLFNKEKLAIEGTKALQENFLKVRFSWQPEHEIELKSIFKEAIAAQSITLDMVRAEKENFDSLKELSDRQIFDKLRSLIRYAVGTVDARKIATSIPLATRRTVDTTVEIPSNNYSVEIPSNNYSVEIPSNNKSTSNLSESEDSEVDDDIFNEAQKGGVRIFPDWAVAVIKERCRDVIKAGSNSISRVTTRLEGCSKGERVLAKFTMPQIQTRIKYERRQYLKRIEIKKGKKKDQKKPK